MESQSDIERKKVQVWRGEISHGLHRSALERFLSGDELERLHRFKIESIRDQFATSRLALRKILAARFRCEPNVIQFLYNDEGKPALQFPREENFSFNVSHSAETILIADGNVGQLGVDIEAPRPGRDYAALADRFFSEREKEWIGDHPESGRVAAFLKIWTRKEALLKACGSGLLFPLSDWDVSEISGAVIGPGDTRWRLYDLELEDESQAALCSESDVEIEFMPPGLPGLEGSG